MDKLNFYTVDPTYVDYLKNAETQKRGFSRVPDVRYSADRKQKFLCGIVLSVNSVEYYVPVSSYKVQQEDNFLISAKNGAVVGSLRFNYMFPVPKHLVMERKISTEPDVAYRNLLNQELTFCIQNQDKIYSLAQRTHKRVLLGKNPNLVRNSCDFALLEEKCLEYIRKDREKSNQVFARSQNSFSSVSTQTVKLGRCKVTFKNLNTGENVSVYLNFTPQNYAGQKGPFLLTADENYQALLKLQTKLKDDSTSNYVLQFAEMVVPTKKRQPKDIALSKTQTDKDIPDDLKHLY